MTLSELAEQLEIAPRQVRFLIGEGILPPANKTGRSADAYDETHLEKARRYLALHRLGMKPASIKVLMSFEDAVPIAQIDGVELRVHPDVQPDAIDIEKVIQHLADALRVYSAKEPK